MESFGDILTAMVTPFTLDLQVDQVAFARLADHLLSSGSDGLVVAGTPPIRSFGKIVKGLKAAGVDYRAGSFPFGP